MCIRDRIKTIMRNLLSNAVKYSPEGSEIIVTVEEMCIRDRLHTE